jgi:pimeloyl-ACP methyl ester carboxylesterase
VAALKLETTTWGDGPRRALIVHGISSNRSGWWRFGPDLAGLGYRVVAPDLRGHGESPKSDRMLIEDYRDDLMALGEGWDLVLGHSLGGAIVLAALEIAPAGTARLVLQDPAIIGSSDPSVRDWLLADYVVPITAERVAEENPRWHPHDAARKAEALRQSGPEVVHRTLEEPWNYWDALAGLTVPTLLIGADPERGALVGPVLGSAAEQANGNIRFVTIPGGSHSMHRDEYDAFWAVVREFAA